MEELRNKLFTDLDDSDAKRLTELGVKHFAMMQSRAWNRVHPRLSMSLGVCWKLATVKNIDPVLALLSLVVYRLMEGKEDKIAIEQAGLSEDARKLLAELSEGARKVLSELAGLWNQTARNNTGLSGKRTLANFPDGFDGKFFVVVGDRRETSGRKMTPADFGALSGSPADLRFLDHLRLPRDFQVITDKVFVMEPFHVLREKFANATLVVVGSPASNHAARIVNRFALHRFNLTDGHDEAVEALIRDAWCEGTHERPQTGTATSSHGFFTAPRSVPFFKFFDSKALAAFSQTRRAEVTLQKHIAFAGGFIDPCSRLVRGTDKYEDRDFAVITLAQNAFRDENDGQYPALFLAGYHLPGTSYTMHEQVWTDRRTFFGQHPFGGILRVDLKPLARHKAQNGQEKSFYSFCERMEEFEVGWDDESEDPDKSGYTSDQLLQSLYNLSLNEPTCRMTRDEAKRAYEFLSKLTGTDAAPQVGNESPAPRRRTRRK